MMTMQDYEVRMLVVRCVRRNASRLAEKINPETVEKIVKAERAIAEKKREIRELEYTASDALMGRD